jgi:hypothetical protein
MRAALNRLADMLINLILGDPVGNIDERECIPTASVSTRHSAKLRMGATQEQSNARRY